ncbi:hypothetical protein G6539_06430 [Streptomyces albidoflavus]|nr:hypothetical protein [Streptomyces albidoflavus]
MSENTQYVTRNGEVSAGVFEWTHRLGSQTVVWVSGGAGAVLGGVMGWFMGEGEEWSAPLKTLGALGVAAVGFLFFWALARYTYSVHLRLKNGQLEGSFNRKTVKLPAGAIAYAGRAEFSKANKRRTSTTSLVLEPGPASNSSPARATTSPPPPSTRTPSSRPSSPRACARTLCASRSRPTSTRGRRPGGSSGRGTAERGRGPGTRRDPRAWAPEPKGCTGKGRISVANGAQASHACPGGVAASHGRKTV